MLQIENLRELTDIAREAISNETETTERNEESFSDLWNSIDTCLSQVPKRRGSGEIKKKM